MAENSFEEIRLLIQGCLQQDREAQRKLYRYFYGYAMSICLRYSKSNEEAREVLNDGFMKVFTKIEKYDTEKSFKGWLRRVMINTALDNYRHNYKHYHHRDLEEAEQEITTESITHQLSHADLMQLVQRLSPGYRAVFNLYAIDGFTHEEIAELLGISVGTSKSNLSKARVNLQAMLKKVNRMNSRNMPEEEELDYMFRQAADSLEPEFDPEAWRQMEQKLDAANRQPSVWGTWAKRTLLALLLLVSGVTVYYFTTREPAPTSGPINATRNNAPVIINTPEPTTPEISVSGNQEPLSATKLADKTPTTNLPAVAEQTNRPMRLLQRPHTLALKALPTAGNKGFTSNQTKQNQLSVPVITNTDLAGTKDFLKNSANPGVNAPSAALNSKISEQTSNPAQTKKPAFLPGTNNSIIDSTAIQTEQPAALIPADKVMLVDSTLANPTAEADSTLRIAPVTFRSKVGVSLVFGPDFSTVGFVRPEKASTNVGVLLSYSFSKRWAVVTGVVRARKVYGAKPEDYHPGPNYWPPGAHLPDDINAVCKVLDIPVNVRYTVVALPRQSIYAQTGLSSYIMLHEDYRYDYSNSGNPYSKHWIVSNKNRHFFQVLNVAVGYSKQIKPGIAVGAEPFVKIPLAGIGAGKVNLTSMGAFFSLSYRFR